MAAAAVVVATPLAAVAALLAVVTAVRASTMLITDLTPWYICIAESTTPVMVAHAPRFSCKVSVRELMPPPMPFMLLHDFSTVTSLLRNIFS